VNKIIVTSMLTLLCSGSLMANEMQVFTGNSMLIPLDKESKFEKIYVGTAEGYSRAKIGKTATAIASIAIGSAVVGTGQYMLHNNSFRDGLWGAAATLIVGGAILSYDLINEDHTYIASYSATNSKGEKTTIASYIVANSAVKTEELETIALSEHKKITQGDKQ
jgi:hypothetical protein